MFNRRQFLEDSILATTAALAGPALAATAVEPTQASPNQRLSVAVIGLGISEGRRMVQAAARFMAEGKLGAVTLARSR